MLRTTSGGGAVGPSGQATFHVIRNGQVYRPSLWWRLRNAPNYWDGKLRVMVAKTVSRLVGVPVMTSELRLKKYHGDGSVTDYGVVGHKVVTTAGVGYIVDAFQNLVEAENMKYHGFGTGTTAEASGDTGLVTELTTEYVVDNTRPTGTTTEGASANIYRTVATLDPDADVAITEHGIFSASSAGVLLDRTKFSAINLSGAGGDTLEATYDLTFTAGG